MSILGILQSLLPGLSSSREDVVSLNDQRLLKYSRNWNHYYGVDLDSMKAEDGTPAPKVNFLRRNIDKINFFSFGLGYEMTHPRYQDHLRVADSCWGLSKIEKLTRMAQFGSVTGDAFIMVAPRSVTELVQKTEESTEKTPSAQVVVSVVPSQYALPLYDPFDSTRMLSMEIKVPFQVKNKEGKYDKFYQYIRITDEIIESGILDNEGAVYGISMHEPTSVLKTQPNPVKAIYCVHIRNFPAGDSVFGIDDIFDAAALNKAYGERLTDIGSIVNYHSAPITCVYGAKAGTLVRGPNKVWGNLPKDGKVENLSMDTDLAAANNHLENIKVGLHEITGVPEIAQGSKQAISNTSGVALHTMYLPLLERSATKQSMYTPGLIEVAVLCIKWAQEIGNLSMIDPVTGTVLTPKPITKPEEWEDLRHNTTTNYPSPLPKDRLIEVQVQSSLLTAKLQSRRRAMVALGVKDPETLIEEIKKEDEEAAKQAQALMKASGLTPDGKPVEPTADSNGNERVDEGTSGINSGAGATQGTTRTDSGEQKGRPRTQG